MIKNLYVCLLVAVLREAGFAQNIPAELGEVFHPSTNLVLHWNASTKKLPTKLWAYRVLPSEFSPTAISNLMAMTSFTQADRDRARTLNPIFNQPGAMTFRSADQSRQMGIYPNLGWIYYENTKAESPRQAVLKPNNDKQTLKLALEDLKKFGVNQNQLATKPHSSELEASYILGKLTIYKTNRTENTFVNKRGIMIARSIDGVNFWGKGERDGFTVEFGNHGEISQLQILWRNLQHDAIYPTLSADKILKSIRDGKSRWKSSFSYDLDWGTARQLTVNKVIPYYFGEEHDMMQSRVQPFATLEAAVDMGTTNRNIYLFCPLIDDAKP